jgi:AraC-like DNA-binding protein
VAVEAPPPLHYQEAPPAPPLAAYVRCYWSLHGAAGGPESALWRILPDGCADVLFEPGREPVRWVGTMTRPLEVFPGRSADMFGVRFEPGGPHALTGHPLHPLTDLTVTPPAGTGEWRPVAEDIGSAPGFEARCRVMNRALFSRLRSARDVALAPLLRRLDQVEELPRVEALAKWAGMSSRTLERRFLDALGVGPKQHLRFVRFNRAHRLIARRGLSGAEIAAEAYFVDEAHFIHEFRRFTGLTPGTFQRLSDFYNSASPP